MTNPKRILIMAGILFILNITACSKDDKSIGKDDGTGQPVRPISSASSPYVDTVWSFTPAPGQFINTGYADPASVARITENETISLGAWGGQIVLGFDHTVLNKQGADLQVEGAGPENAAEPGVVWVMYDANGNQKPDDTWYELKGSAYGRQGYRRNYSVTYYKPADNATDIKWVDSDNNSGYVKLNRFHEQSYYPSWITADHYTLEGTLLPASGIDSSNPDYMTSAAFEYGYADNHTKANGGNPLDISHAIDDQGEPVDLIGIDFIKIQTGIISDLGWLGECSTEVTSVGDLHML